MGLTRNKFAGNRKTKTPRGNKKRMERPRYERRITIAGKLEEVLANLGPFRLKRSREETGQKVIKALKEVQDKKVHERRQKGKKQGSPKPKWG